MWKSNLEFKLNNIDTLKRLFSKVSWKNYQEKDSIEGTEDKININEKLHKDFSYLEGTYSLCQMLILYQQSLATQIHLCTF